MGRIIGVRESNKEASVKTGDIFIDKTSPYDDYEATLLLSDQYCGRLFSGCIGNSSNSALRKLRHRIKEEISFYNDALNLINDKLKR